jgi:peptidoglycan/LPS O-acetylase OafA/YrhL
MLGIFSHHLGMAVIQDPQTMLERVVHSIVYVGKDGVIFFNIISGFLLAYPYLGPAQQSLPNYRTFLRKRFLRIIPAYYIALLVFSAANVVVFNFPAESSLRYMLEHAIFVNSFDYQTLNLNTAAFWYMGMLAQFYLVFPFVLRIFRRVGPTRGALSLIALSWGACFLASRHFSANPDSLLGTASGMMYFNLPVRLPEFAIGMWLAAIWNPAASSSRESRLSRPFRLLIAGMVLYVLICALFPVNVDDFSSYLLHASVAVPLFALLFLWSPMSQVAGFSVVRKLSKHSFDIYLVHQPILSYFGVMSGNVPGSITELLKLSLVFFPLSYLAATVLDWAAGMVPGFFQRKSSEADRTLNRDRFR